MLRNDQEEARNDKPPKQNDHRDYEAKKYHDIKKRDHTKTQNNHNDNKLLKTTKATERDENTKRHNRQKWFHNIKRLQNDARDLFLFSIVL